MPLYKQGHKTIYQIHIPRTGGRYVRDLLKRNGFTVDGWNFTERHKETGVEIPHLQYKYLKDLNLDCDLFSVIRNPIDRFKATMSNTSYFAEYEETKYFKRPDIFLNEITSYQDFIEKIEYRNTHLRCNSFINQTDFINDNTKLYKFENGFEDNFINWFNNNFNTNIVKKDIMTLLAVPLTKDRSMKNSFDNKITVELSSKILDYVNRYYEKDMELWERI